LLRAQLAFELGGVPPELPERMRAALETRKGRLTANDLLRMLHALLELEPMYRRSGQPQLLLETLLVRFALLDRTIDLEEVLRGFSGGSGEDPPARRVAHESRVASAHALPANPAPAVAPALPAAPPPVAYAPPPPTPRTATQQVASAAAAAQLAPPPRRTNASPAEAVAPPPAPLVQQRWNEVADALRAKGRGMVAEAIQRLKPLAVSAHGALSIGYEAADDTWATMAENARADVLAALQQVHAGLTTFSLTTHGVAAPAPAAARPTKRLTAHDVQQQRTEQMASKDPLLDAAVKALELELLD
jgi:DNA polymerase-3 subunit gamma/tau